MEALPPGRRPRGVAVLAALHVAAGAGTVLLALFVAAVAAYVAAAPPAAVAPRDRAALDASLAVALLLLPLGALGAVVGVGLWRGRTWAWSLSVALAAAGLAVQAAWLVLVPGVLTDAAVALGGAAGLALGLGVLAYWLRPGVKRWFGRGPARAGAER